MIQITPELAVNEDEFQFEYTRSPGPGGQHVNKASTAVQLRFDIVNSQSLPEPVRHRLITLAGKRLSADGSIVIHAHRYRSQARNRQDAVDRLVLMIKKAALPPKPRKKTRPSRLAKERRLAKKRRRSMVKKLRKQVRGLED